MPNKHPRGRMPMHGVHASTDNEQPRSHAGGADIVERLRHCEEAFGPECDFLIKEAADEIERLRKDAMSYANVRLSEENDALIAEIERLCADNSSLRKHDQG